MKPPFLSMIALLVLAGSLAAAEPSMLFEDTFAGKLGDGWTWLRENPAAWRVQKDGLEIRVEPGVAHNVKNALLRAAPDRGKKKYAVEVTVTFTTPPTRQYEQGGITWYHQKKPVFKLVHEHIDGKLWIIPGRKPAPGNTVRLRLVVDGRNWTAQYRQNAKGEFQTAASGKLPPPGDDQVSIQCYNGPPDAEHWVRFDDFRIVELAK